MIEARELRIGNLVIFMEDSTTFTVDLIETDGIGVHNENESTWIEINQFDGILLTEEWLIGLGFSKGEKTVSEGQSFNIEIGSDRKLHINALNYNPHAWIRDYFTQSTLDDFVFISHPKYVHQLQNLFYAITGQELQYENKTTP